MAGGRGDAGGHLADAFSAELDSLLLFYAPDVVCHPAPGWVDGDAACHGHDGFRQLGAVWATGVDDPAVEIEEVRDLHDRFLIYAHFTGRSRESGKPIRQSFAAINSDLRPDGKVGEVHFFLSREEALRAVDPVHSAPPLDAAPLVAAGEAGGARA